MLWSLALLATLGVAATSPVETNSIRETVLKSRPIKNNLLEGHMRGLLEKLRKNMLIGTETMPVLDPFKLGNLTIEDNVVPQPRFKFDIGDATVSKLSTFVVEHLAIERVTLIPLRYRIELCLYIPALRVDAKHYDLSASFEGVEIYGTGDFVVNMVEPKISGYVIARPSFGLGTLFIRLERCNLNFSLEAFEPYINGLLGGSANVSNYINTFLSFLIPDLIKHYKNDITEFVSTAVLEIGNDLLSDVNVIGIMAVND